MKIFLVNFFLLFFILLPVTNLSAAESMRRCMLLPVNDSVDGAIGFSVFKDVEYYLKNSEWCYYKSNSGIMDILGSHKKNLNEYLNNKDVLNVIAKKTKSGSLIKIKLTNQVKGMDVELKIIGENGEDIYFKQNTRITTLEPTVISRTINNWLSDYEKVIPYDGRTLGVLGNQFTVDLGKSYGIRGGDEVEVRRVIQKKRHPLLKEIVDWDTELIAKAKIFHVSLSQAQGKVIQYETKKRLALEDWVILKKNEQKRVQVPEANFEEDKTFEFGKLGKIGFHLDIADSTVISTDANASIRQMGGLLVGAYIDATIWITRNYWIGLDLAKRFGSLDAEEGTLSKNSNSVSNGITKLKVGYKYLPLGFFYGPQVDGYIGYARYNFGLDNQSSDDIGEVTFKGLLLGGKGDIPIYKNIRTFLGIDFIFKPNYEEAVLLYGEKESSSNFHLTIGGSMSYGPNMSFESSLNFYTSKAKFADEDEEYKYKDTSLRLGATFLF